MNSTCDWLICATVVGCGTAPIHTGSSAKEVHHENVLPAHRTDNDSNIQPYMTSLSVDHEFESHKAS